MIKYYPRAGMRAARTKKPWLELNQPGFLGFGKRKVVQSEIVFQSDGSDRVILKAVQIIFDGPALFREKAADFRIAAQVIR
jgi:hypothetical protein